jgi:hypothetical protein
LAKNSHLDDHSPEEILHNAYNRSEGDAWSATHYFGVGLWVRNKLRQRFAWDDLTLGQAWAGLIEETVKRNMEGEG